MNDFSSFCFIIILMIIAGWIKGGKDMEKAKLENRSVESTKSLIDYLFGGSGRGKGC